MGIKMKSWIEFGLNIYVPSNRQFLQVKTQDQSLGSLGPPLLLTHPLTRSLTYLT